MIDPIRYPILAAHSAQRSDKTFKCVDEPMSTEEECLEHGPPRNLNGYTHEEWIADCDYAVSQYSYGAATLNDLGDIDTWNKWNDGVSPEEAASEALEQEGFVYEIQNPFNK
jgi:hypothetical protein